MAKSDRAAPVPSTAALSDAMDRIGLECVALGILPIGPGLRIAGPAFTVEYAPVTPGSGGTVGDYLDDVEAGSVVVLDNSGRLDCTVWGGILTSVAAAKGIVGTVIDGVCRDTAESARLGYPVFSRGRTMRTGKDRVEAVSIQSPVHLAGLRVEPGDMVVGDEDGVVVIPANLWPEVVEHARQIEAAEAAIESAVSGGESLADARLRLGYHGLQRGGE